MSDTDTTKRCPPIDITVGRWSVRTTRNEEAPLSIELDGRHLGDFTEEGFNNLAIAMIGLGATEKEWEEMQS